jgi:hypothetical protein
MALRELVGKREIGRTTDETGIGLPQCHDLLEIEISAIDNRKMRPSRFHGIRHDFHAG